MRVMKSVWAGVALLSACRSPSGATAQPSVLQSAIVLPTPPPSSVLSPPPPEANDAAPALKHLPPVEGQRMESPPEHFASVAAFCVGYVARAKRGLAAFQSSLPRRTPSCHEIPLPVRFTPSSDIRTPHAVALEEGLASTHALVVTLPEGVAESPIEWDTDLRSSSISAQHAGTFESLTIDHGVLVAVLGRAQGWPSQSGAPRFALRRSVIACTLQPSYECVTYFPNEENAEGFLGVKVRPWEATTAWSILPWQQPRGFTLTGNTLTPTAERVEP